MKRKYVLFVLLMALLAPLAMNAQGLMKKAVRPDLKAQAVLAKASETQTSLTRDPGWLQYDDGEVATNIGNSQAYYWTYGPMYPASMLGTNNTLSRVAFYENNTYMMTDVTIEIYSGGDEEPGDFLYTEDVELSGTDGFHDVELAEPVTIDPTQNLWIILTVGGTYALPACASTEPNNNWVYSNGWSHIGDLAPTLAGYGWMIRGYVEYVDPANSCPKPTQLSATNITTNSATLSWHSSNEVGAWQIVYSTEEGFNPDNASPIDVGQTSYTLTNLNDATYYVYVRSMCDKNVYSDWSSMLSFTTVSACTTPFGLDASNITPNSADISWNGWQDTYNVRYQIPVFYDSFEDGLDNWTIYTEGEAPQANGWYVTNPSNITAPHSGSNLASSWSWASEPYDANNWLITPQLALQGTLSFWVYTNSGYPDSYEVLLSTTGNAIEQFTYTLQEMAPAPDNGEWNLVEISLSAFAGQQGYIAIHHVDYDMNYLFIDDFVVLSDQWISASNVTSPYTLPNLAEESTYVYQVQGNCPEGTTSWSAMNAFTTPSACSAPSNLNATDITYNSAVLSWTGYQQTYTIQYTPMTSNFAADFSNGIPEGWTTIDADGDGFNWGGGEGYVYSESFDNETQDALTPDNWLITPQINLSGTLYVTAYGADPDYCAEHFAIYYSNSGTNPEDFTQISEEYITTGTSTVYEVDLSQYSGNGYLAIRHFNVSDEFILVVSGFEISSIGETVTIENVTNPYTLENLTQNTQYEVMVKGICTSGETEWSETYYFTTPALCVVPTDLESTDVTHNSATLSWTGDPEGYNLRYRTSSYNEVLFYDSFEEGVTDWTQSDGGVYTGIPYDGTHMYLLWGEAEPQYLISPELTGLDRGGYIMFYYRYYQGAMTFNVGYSSTTADITAFQWNEEVTSTNSYSLYLDAIPEGTKYIAIQSTGTNEAYALLIDYFVVFGPTIPAGEWTTLNNVENPYTLENLNVNTEYEWQVQTISDNCAGGLSDWSESDYFLTESGLIFITDGNWNDGANWYLGEVPADFSDVTVNASAIIPADYDAKINTVIFGEGGSITIKDGGQLHGNDYVTATVEKEITSYEGNGNYYLIANPLRYNINLATTSTGLLDGDYDLYGFNATEEMLEWRNYKTEAFNIRTGFGYLYANGEDVTLQFTGELVPQHNNLYYNAVELSYDEDNDQLNWNLVGNMYGHNGYVYVGGVDNGYVVFAENQYYYKMNEAGTDVIASNEIVKPCEGVFVQASDTAQYAFFSSVPHNISSKGLDMNLVQDNNLIDVVLIRFGEGRNLQKFQLNPNHTKVYMTEGDKDYSVLFAKDNGMMPVSFKAEKEGNYTLSFTSREITYSYLHLIDNLTNTEVDLLANPEYTFKTEAGDFAKRFTIVYEVK